VSAREAISGALGARRARAVEMADSLTSLTRAAWPSNNQRMAHSFLIFDFGSDEDAAQHARHRLEGWKQSFRLDKKLQLKFERKETEADAKAAGDGEESAKAAKPAAKGKAKGKGKAGAKSKSGGESAEAGSEAAATPDQQDIRLIVRLDFSDHEKLSHQRWLERIPADELFKNAKPQVVRAGEPQFKATSDLFDSLD